MPEPFEFDVAEAESPGRLELGSHLRGDESTTHVIAKVRTPNYVPPGFEVRTRIDATMFTADASHHAVTAAGDDPDVESVALARRLNRTD